MVYPKKVDTNQVKKLREEGLTMDQIAEKLDVSKTTIWRHLKGEIKTSVTKVTIPKELIEQAKNALEVAARGARSTERDALKVILEYFGIRCKFVKNGENKRGKKVVWLE